MRTHYQNTNNTNNWTDLFQVPGPGDARCHLVQAVQPYSFKHPARCVSTRGWVDISVSCVLSLSFKSPLSFQPRCPQSDGGLLWRRRPCKQYLSCMSKDLAMVEMDPGTSLWMSLLYRFIRFHTLVPVSFIYLTRHFLHWTRWMPFYELQLIVSYIFQVKFFAILRMESATNNIRTQITVIITFYATEGDCATSNGV